MSQTANSGASWGLVVATPPAEEPVTVAQARAHCRIDDEAEDDQLERWIVSARMHVELVTRRALVTQTLRLSLRDFPRVLTLPRAPLQSVTSITYRDLTGELQTLASDRYWVDEDAEPAEVAPGGLFLCWPMVQANRPGAVKVTYVAGYGDADAVPAPLVAAILLLVADQYEHREARLEQTAADNPTVQRLLDPYRVPVTP